jgi:hypothetical protein
MADNKISWTAPDVPAGTTPHVAEVIVTQKVVTDARIRRARALRVVLAAILAIGAVAVLQRHGVGATSGTAGPASVTVTPTTGLTDGQGVEVTATFAAGSVLQMTAHLCKHNAPIANDADFAFDGPWCSPNKVSPSADTQRQVNLSPSSTSASFTNAGTNAFHVGIGTGASWQDFTSATNTLTCDAQNMCDLVVEFNIPSGAAFFVAPLTFAGAESTTTSGATTTGPGTTAPATTAPVTTAPVTTAPVTTAPVTTAPVTTTPTTTVPATTAPVTTSKGGTTTTVASVTTASGAAGTTTPVVIVAGTGSSSGSGGALAFTGAGTRDLLSAAVLLLAAGLFLIAAALRRPSTA